MGNFFVADGAALTSENDKWTTPRNLFAQLNSEFKFNLDAAALSNSALCENWYGPDHPDESRRDALTRNWVEDSEGKAIFLNPPYGKDMKRWMSKADMESRGGGLVVCLLPSRTDTAWWWDHCMHHEIRFIRGRLKFGGGKQSAPFASAIVVMRVVDNPGVTR